MKQPKERRLHPLYIVVFLYIGFIFYHSLMSGDASGSLSAQIAETILSMLEKIGLHFNFDAFHHFIRKLAHFSEYFVLALLVYQAAKKKPLFSTVLITLIIFGITVPLLDETIQLFTPGRVGALKDCLIDMSGYGTAALLSALCQRRT